jgi:two-component system, sensor histidine kinase
VSAESRDARIEHDRVHALYAQGPLASVIALFIGGLIVVAMWRSVPHLWLWVWYALIAANQAARLVMVRAFRRENPSGARLRAWALRYTIGMAVGAAIFGSVALFMFPLAGPLGQVFLMISVCGMAAGSITANAYHPPAMVAYFLFMLVPMFLRLTFEGGFEYGLLAFSFASFLIVVLAFGRNQAQLIRRSIAMGYENIELVEELKAKTALAEAAQRKAEQASFAKSQFFAAASHDLRQPMQALGLYAASLRGTTHDPAASRQVDQILSSVDALESLFDELLDISKLDAGYVKPVPIHFAAQPLLERLGTAYAPLARKSGLVLVFDDAGAVLHTDSVLLERVLGNFLSNALRYTQTGSVTVRCVPLGESVRIEVVDTGQGIPYEEHERVFDEFYQLGNPERDRRKGLGLGLATVKRIAQLLGCQVSLDSAPGRGSVFRIDVPKGDPACIAAPAQAPSAEDVDTLHGKLIAVVEDEREVREGMTELLGLWRCKVVVASSAAEVLKELEQAGAQPDAVIADYRLRAHENGVGAISALRSRYGEALPALLVSGDTTQDIFKTASQARLPLLSKPVRAARLRAALAHLLAGARA